MPSKIGNINVKKPIGQNFSGEMMGARQAIKNNSSTMILVTRKNPLVNSRKNLKMASFFGYYPPGMLSKLIAINLPQLTYFQALIFILFQ
ncbi:hypothetical protein COR50_05715 [Chitinophaga caeni]|uniref:Uncharacterized protein n=1 Tax=Chitinophaga caeni TaxID=2029983 RepID=A0A291QRU7_9BACT|nr:hypothetical protein COR50_05715 [Chitinophaga caeni]